MLDAIQGKPHPQDQPSTGLLFEETVAVSEIALAQVEIAQLTRLAVQRGQAGEYVLDLHAIGADVLHGRGTDSAGDQAEVFQPRQSLGQGVLNERMPRLARLGFDDNAAAVIAENANATAGHAQHQRLDIAGQQQIAATANHQQRHVLLCGIGQGLTHIGIAVSLGKQPGPDIHAKGIERLEGNLALYLQTHNRLFNSMTS
ncbi:hypothetical protein D3C73_1061990 [compost metagenome]